jgi:hypothetical protein
MTKSGEFYAFLRKITPLINYPAILCAKRIRTAMPKRSGVLPPIPPVPPLWCTTGQETEKRALARRAGK